MNGAVTEIAKANLDALVAHIDDELQLTTLPEEAAEREGSQWCNTAPSVAVADGAGRTIQSILATEFGVDPDQVTEYLRAGDRVEKLNTAVDVIEPSEEVAMSEEYGQNVFVRPAYRYRLTERAMELVAAAD